MISEQIENIFKYHAPTETQKEIVIRSQALQLGIIINDCCPESREKSLAITNLQQTVVWAIASIAINSK